MATKTITITTEAYDRLSGLKRQNESFSQAIMRLTGASRITEFAGILSAMEAQDLEHVAETMRKKEKMHSLRGDLYHL